MFKIKNKTSDFEEEKKYIINYGSLSYEQIKGFQIIAGEPVTVEEIKNDEIVVSVINQYEKENQVRIFIKPENLYKGEVNAKYIDNVERKSKLLLHIKNKALHWFTDFFYSSHFITIVLMNIFGIYHYLSETHKLCRFFFMIAVGSIIVTFIMTVFYFAVEIVNTFYKKDIEYITYKHLVEGKNEREKIK